MSSNRLRRAPFLTSLSARLLVLTVFFVMLSEVFIFAPSIGRFRFTYLEERIASAHIAALALEATPDYMVSEELEAELLDHASAYIIVVDEPGKPRKLMLERATTPPADATYDLREETFFGLIGDAFMTLVQAENRVLRVQGPSPRRPDVLLEVLLDESPMRMAMLDYSQRILALSIFISVITATLVYLSLHWLMVLPMRRITESMVDFRDDPESRRNVVAASDRRDEIGMAQRELADMQIGLRAALRQKARLAALGSAVTKISHDLRNILSTMQLESDRLAGSDDPQVKRVVPKLLMAIDRAVNLCGRTLDYAREDQVAVRYDMVSLRDVVDDVASGLAAEGGSPLRNDVDTDLKLQADREQLLRVFTNLGQNAAEAGAAEVRISAERVNGLVRVDVIDDGPGLPPIARDNLFKPFAGSARPGGTGLGLPIAREILQAHGGDLELLRSDGSGTAFRIKLPVRATG